MAYDRGIDHQKTIGSIGDDDFKFGTGIDSREQYVARCVRHSAVLSTFCEDIPYFEIIRITTFTKWLERHAFVVLIWVEKESSKKQTHLT